jgi:hypothetical protein
LYQPLYELLMKRGLPLAFLIHFVLVQSGFGQIPSVQLKIRESSGFLGLGGARYVELKLSDDKGDKSLNSVNVNSGQYYYFVCTPVGDWQLDPDLVSENLRTLVVQQNNQRTPLSFTGDISTEGDTTTVLFGFEKSFRLDEPFLFRIQLAKALNQVEFKVPEQYWAGYDTLAALLATADRALAAGRYREAISIYSTILTDNIFEIFPQREETKARIIRTFQTYLNVNVSAFQALKDSTQMDPRRKIVRAADFRPKFMYVVDSLPQLRFEVVPYDSSLTHLLDQARDAVLQIGSVTDSLQNSLDEMAVRWILDGSVTGRMGAQFQTMIEALAYAYSSLNFSDTTAATMSVTLPPAIKAGLQQNGILESYTTFVRVCSDRYAMHLAVFPVDFLPNLRRDAAAFPLPYYLMLKTVSDYYAGNLTLCREQITGIFRTCSDDELLSRFDKMRVVIGWRLNRVPQNVLRLLGEAKELQASDDSSAAGDKYRQTMILAPDFAYAAFASGVYNASTGDSALALGLFQKAYQLDTLYLSAYREAYRLYRAQNNYASMINVMTLALARGNDFWITNYSLGQAFMSAGEPARGVKSFLRAYELNPQSYKTCMQLGKAYQATKDFAHAREYFNKAIEVDALRKEAVDALSNLNDQERKAR